MSAYAPTPASRHRFHLLDALRGIAALFVILVHAPAYVQARIPPANAFLAVDLFFCLSGFVLAHTYRQRFDQGLGVRAFLLARLIRLYPTYLLGASLGLFWALTIDRVPFLPHLLRLGVLDLLLLPNLAPHVSRAAFPFDLPAWSLFFELLINVPFAVLARSRATERLKLSFVACAMLFSMLALCRWLAQGLALGDLGWSSDPHAFGYTFARVCFSFSFGLVLHALYQKQQRPRTQNAVTSCLLASAMIATLALLLHAPWPYMQNAGFQLLYPACFLPGIIFLSANCRLPQRFNQTCALLGDISYPLYLLHVPLLRILGTRHVALYALAHPRRIDALFGLAVAAIVSLAYLAMRFYDIPLRRLLQQVSR